MSDRPQHFRPFSMPLAEDVESDETLKLGLLAALVLILIGLWMPLPSWGRDLVMQVAPDQQPQKRHVLKPKPKEVVRRTVQQRRARQQPMPDRTPDMPEPVIAAPNVVAPDVAWQGPDWDVDMAPPPPQQEDVLTMASLGLEPPVITRRVRPNYPERAQRVGLQGYVIVEAVMRKDGSITDARVVRQLGRGKFGFETAALAALQQWEFEPGKVQGRAVDVRMHFTVHFQLQR